MPEPRQKIDKWGVGVNADGTLNTFPESDLAARAAQRDAEMADADDENLSDLGAVEKAFEGAGDAWSESDHPRGQPENPGEFAPSGGLGGAENKGTLGRSKDEPNLRHENYQEGSSLPPTIFRGGKPGDFSASWNDGPFAGAFVSASRDAAKQYGDLAQMKLKREPKLLDMGNWYAAKTLVARAMNDAGENINIGAMTKPEYDDLAGDAFIQMYPELRRRLARAGYNGARLGPDAFLIGPLSSWAEKSD